MDDVTSEVTLLVERWSRGDPDALDQLIEVAYDDLRQIARRQLGSWGSGQSIETTALVHELYFRLAGVEEGSWGGRSQFFAFCAKAMRRMLIDFARRRNASKRGGHELDEPLHEESAAVDSANEELLALDEALDNLATHNARMAQVVECRFFGGLSVDETAAALGTSSRTVEREWVRARAYLQHSLCDESSRADEEGEK